MNIQCCVCTARKIATSFHSLDELQAHLFSHHHDGFSTAFRFMCRNCDLDFATEYRLLKHRETCGTELRNPEYMQNNRYKIQVFKWIEESLKYSMTKNRVSSVPATNPCDFETPETRIPQMQRQPKSTGTGRIKSELTERSEHAALSSNRHRIVMNGFYDKTVTNPSPISNESTKNFVKQGMAVEAKQMQAKAANLCDFETPETRTPQMQRQPKSTGTGRIKSELTERSEHAASSSNRQNIVMNRICDKTVTNPSPIESTKNFVKRAMKSEEKQDQNCSDSSAAGIQSHSKPKVQKVVKPEVEIIKTVDSTLKWKAPSKSVEHTSGDYKGNLQQEVVVLGENKHSRKVELAKKLLVSREVRPDHSHTNQETSIAQSSTTVGVPVNLSSSKVKLSGPNNQRKSAAKPTNKNRWPLMTQPQTHESGMNAKKWSQDHSLSSFDKPRYK